MIDILYRIELNSQVNRYFCCKACRYEVKTWDGVIPRYDFIFFNSNDDLTCIIDKSYVKSIYHYDNFDNIVIDKRTYDYQLDVLPFPEVECRFKVFSDCFETEFNKYSEALEFARFNACAVFDCESCKILDDYREDF